MVGVLAVVVVWVLVCMGLECWFKVRVRVRVRVRVGSER